MSINNIKRLLLSLVIGLCAGSVSAGWGAFGTTRTRRASMVTSAASRAPKARTSFGPQQVRRGQ